MQFKQSLKQEIMDKHLKSHGGKFGPPRFPQGSREKTCHPAHDYFTWDDTKASHEYRLGEASHFASDLRITVQAKAIIAKPVRVNVTQKTTTVNMPAVVSEGQGFYVSTETKIRGAAFCMDEAANALEQWLRGTADFVGVHVRVEAVQKLAAALRARTDSDAA